MIGLSDLCEATGGQLYGEATVDHFDGLADDPLSVTPGCLFVNRQTPEMGQKKNIEQAIARGASGLLCDAPPHALGHQVTTVLVGDTRIALEQWASYILRQYGSKVVAVVGTSGNTYARRSIAAVLGCRYSVFTQVGAYHGPYSLALSLAGLKPQHQLAIIECPLDGYSSLRDFEIIVQPKVVVLADADPPVSRAIAAYLPSTLFIDLARALPDAGSIVYNQADMERWRIETRPSLRQVSVGSALEPVRGQPDLKADNLRVGIRDVAADLQFGNSTFRDVRFDGMGIAAVRSGLTALAVGTLLDISLDAGITALRNQQLPDGVNMKPGPGGSLLVDLSGLYPPEFILQSLDWLSHLEAFGMRCIVLIAGLDRGDDALNGLYQTIGTRAASCCDFLVGWGEGPSRALIAARRAGFPSQSVQQVFQQDDLEEVVLGLRLGERDIVLIVGASGGRMAQVMDRLFRGSEPDVIATQSTLSELHVSPSPKPATWLEIDLGAIASNVRYIRQQLLGGGMQLMAVAGDDGYSHGCIETAVTALRAGAAMVAVSSPEEGLMLRESGIDQPVLVMGYASAHLLPEAIACGLIVTVHSRAEADGLAYTARQLKRIGRCHVRVAFTNEEPGILIPELVLIIRELARTDAVVLDGLYGKLVAPQNSTWESEARSYLRQFQVVQGNLSAAGLSIPNFHLAGSAGLLRIPESRFNLVRVGHLIYGFSPFAGSPRPEGLTAGLRWKTTIVDLRDDRPPARRSGRTTQSERRVAVLPVGYASGIRVPSRPHQLSVLIGGQRAQLTDGIGPDWSLVDVTELSDACIGDEAVLIGEQGGARISVEDIAGGTGLSCHDVVSGLSRLYPRTFGS